MARQLTERTGYTISPIRAHAFLMEISEACADSLEVARYFDLSWSGFLGIDGKAVLIKDIWWHLLLAVDTGTRDIVNFLLAPEEDYPSYHDLLWETVAGIGYPLRGAVSDLDQSIKAVMRDHFGKVPHQRCLVHIEATIDRLLPKRKRTREQWSFKQMFDSVIYAESKSEARENLDDLIRESNQYQGEEYDYLRGMLARNFDGICEHFSHRGLPPENNITEGVISQLSGKLKLTKGFETYDTACSLIKLMVFWYRTKPFTDSVVNHYNKRSPLEIAGADLGDRSWVDLSQMILRNQGPG
ncbi:MAG: transposase [Actinobacteria bacterium]|nr:transposase [Actinomycetota bacterium]MBU4217344.1 transposase [Actinomycetota bacterium]MBU4359503.1 transposase [Actinomycetota bacterium]